MDFDFELKHYLVIAGMWIFILFLIWGVKMGFSGLKEKITITVVALPIVIGIVSWQKDVWLKMKIIKYLISLARPILITSNLIVFTTFIVTGFVMYRLGNKYIALVLFFAAFLYILFNKIESMDRRIKELEGRWKQLLTPILHMK